MPNTDAKIIYDSKHIYLQRNHMSLSDRWEKWSKNYGKEIQHCGCGDWWWSYNRDNLERAFIYAGFKGLSRFPILIFHAGNKQSHWKSAIEAGFWLLCFDPIKRAWKLKGRRSVWAYGGLLHNSRHGLFDVSQCAYAILRLCHNSNKPVDSDFWWSGSSYFLPWKMSEKPCVYKGYSW